ncbi:hypothetical protein EY643_01690 [Halioglobus maricola]|uniref:Uncharacterized protein n=1 Tax=Halioglobus maricola TaxID=2601894 RepID=A0A5P9NHG8_9GAMM|nr:hypothetical protein [Halioglobus maricola]QFU74468.1 hypothetical protein EY643_01690 [Halioglobus maricola]
MLPESNLRELKVFLGQYAPVSAAYFCREIHSWMDSNTAQAARSGLITEPTSYATAARRYFDYPRKLTRVFGIDSTRFIKFEDAAKAGLTSTFLREFSLPDLEAMGLPEERRNPSLSARAVECLLLLNKLYPLHANVRPRSLQKSIEALPGEKYRSSELSPEEIAHFNRNAEKLARELGHRIYDLLPAKSETSQREGSQRPEVGATETELQKLLDEARSKEGPLQITSRLAAQWRRIKLLFQRIT